MVTLSAAAMALSLVAGSSDREQQRPSVADAQALAASAAMLADGRARRGGAGYYRRTARKRVSATAVAGFLPLYREAERVYRVNWRLIASIHRQETAFSTAPSTYHGLNAFGCCAGPMQFNVTNGPVSTWKLYRQAFRAGRRPGRYPHRTRSHPSIYDDFDAVMAAGSLLNDAGAGRWLDFGAWSAAYSYYGHDLFGVSYANQVLARAEAWQRDGFCPNCALDDGLVAEFDDAYGAAARRHLVGAERRRKNHKRSKLGGRKSLRRERHRRPRGGGSQDRSRHLSPAGDKGRSRPPAAQMDRPTKPSPSRPPRGRTEAPEPSPPPPTPPQPAPTPPVPPPPADDCDLIRKLLGC